MAGGRLRGVCAPSRAGRQKRSDGRWMVGCAAVAGLGQRRSGTGTRWREGGTGRSRLRPDQQNSSGWCRGGDGEGEVRHITHCDQNPADGDGEGEAGGETCTHRVQDPADGDGEGEVRHIPIVSRIQPMVPSPPQQMTRRSGTSLNSWRPCIGPPLVRLYTCRGFSRYCNRTMGTQRSAAQLQLLLGNVMNSMDENGDTL